MLHTVRDILPHLKGGTEARRRGEEERMNEQVNTNTFKIFA